MPKKEALKNLLSEQVLASNSEINITLPKLLRLIKALGVVPYVRTTKNGDVLNLYVKTRLGNVTIDKFIGSEFSWKKIKVSVIYDKKLHHNKVQLSNLNLTMLD